MLSTKFKESLGPIFPLANSIRLLILRIALRGNIVYCPCCKSSFRVFATFGNDRRKNAWCPNCEGLERHRLLWIFLEQCTDLYTSKHKLLHVAPETIFFDHFLKMENIEYYPVDIYPNLYPKGTKYFDILDPQNSEKNYDVIICNHVFQYIENDKGAMKNLFSMLRPGGWAILQVPINQKSPFTKEDASIKDPIEREKIFGLKEHVRYYGYDYAERLREAGFTVAVEDFTGKFTDEEIFKYGFFKGDSIYFCFK